MSSQEPRTGGQSVCSAEHARILDNAIRRLLHNPDKILAGLVKPGQTALDVGCGPGFFTIAMAKLVGENGRVIAVDLQQGMLDRARAKAAGAGLESRISFHKSESDIIGVDEQVDFALAFYMVHEVPDPEKFLAEVFGLLKPGGLMLLVEPKFHVPGPAFEKTVDIARDLGLKVVSHPKIILSRSVVLKHA